MRNLHVVSHTHWDREWYLPFQTFRLKLVHLIDGLLDLLEKDPQFRYFMLDGQTIVLDDYLALRPENEAILRQYILKGRILIGPWHILPDMFLVGPEAHIRNLLQGDRTARKFGPKMMIGYIPDPFGHPGQVPQILRGFGIETACLWRGLDEQPAELWWESPDGSRVLLTNLRDGYGNGASLPADNLPVFANALSVAADSLAGHTSVTDYLIMFGTDHMEPPPGTSKAITYADRHLAETHVIHSTLPKFVASLQKDIRDHKLALTTVSGELRACRRAHLLPGVLSTRMWIKQRNHASENLLTKWVEPFIAFQELFARNTQPTILHQKSSILHFIWLLLMENHPHDSICGCSIDQVHDEMKVRFDQVDQIGEELSRQSLESLAGAIHTQISTSSPMHHQGVLGIENIRSAIVIFNPISSNRTDLVTLTLELPNGVEAFDVMDENGAIIPHQAQGLGSRELLHMVLDPIGLRSAFAYVRDGRAASMTIQDVIIRREDTQVYIDAILADDGEPNLAAWKAGLKQIEEILTDPAVSDYHVRARSTPTTRILFIAPVVPGQGYRTFWLQPRPAKARAPLRLGEFTIKVLLPLSKLPLLQALSTRQRNTRPPHRIENEFFVVEACRDGTVSLLDKRDDRRYTGLNRFLDGGDCGDEYNYSPPIKDRFASPHLKHMTVVRGPVQQSICLDLELTAPASLAFDRKSRGKETSVIQISTIIILSSAVPRVDIRTTINNGAKDHRLRVHFPANFPCGIGSQDGHFEVVERQVGLPAFDETWREQPRPEEPQRAFTDISDGRCGLMLANRGLPEIEVLKNALGNAEIALTLLRCVGWLSRDDFSTRTGHAGPFLETPGAQLPGKWEFHYSIIPHSGNWQSAFWHAYAFETPLRGITTDRHAGDLPSSGAFVETTPETFVVSAIKPPEGECGLLVRGYNITAEAISVTVKPWKVFRRVELVNLAEKKPSFLKPDKTGCVTFPVRGHEIVSVLFQI